MFDSKSTKLTSHLVSWNSIRRYADSSLALWMVERDARCEAQARSAGARMYLHRLDWSFAYVAFSSQVSCRGVVYAISATAFADERHLQLVLRDGHFGCWTGDFTPECTALLSEPSN